MPSLKSYTGYVYLIGSAKYGWFKIGKSRSPELRVNSLGILLPFKVDLYAMWGSNSHSLLEAAFHRLYAAHRINGEWFGLTPEMLKGIIGDCAPHLAERIFPLESCGDIRVIRSSVTEDHSRPKHVGNPRWAHYMVLSNAIELAYGRFPNENRTVIKRSLRSAVNGLWGRPLDIFTQALDSYIQQHGSVEPEPPGL